MSFCRSFHSWQVRVNIMISNKRLMCDASQAKLQWTQAVYKKGITFAASDYHVLLKINEHSKGPGCWFNSSRHQRSCRLQIWVEEFMQDPKWESLGQRGKESGEAERERERALLLSGGSAAKERASKEWEQWGWSTPSKWNAGGTMKLLMSPVLHSPWVSRRALSSTGWILSQ